LKKIVSGKKMRATARQCTGHLCRRKGNMRKEDQTQKGAGNKTPKRKSHLRTVRRLGNAAQKAETRLFHWCKKGKSIQMNTKRLNAAPCLLVRIFLHFIKIFIK
jgi:hypothetical protein